MAARDNWSYNKRPLRLHEILEEIEQIENDLETSHKIILLPPENANTEVTDEDSGSEDEVTIQNLHGSHLRAEAEIERIDENSDEDDLPLSNFVRSAETVPSLMKRKKSYSWKSGETISKNIPDYEKPIGPRNNLTPVQQLRQFLDSEVIDMITKYTNLYAFQKGRLGDVTSDEIMCFIACAQKSIFLARNVM